MRTFLLATAICFAVLNAIGLAIFVTYWVSTFSPIAAVFVGLLFISAFYGLVALVQLEDY